MHDTFQLTEKMTPNPSSSLDKNIWFRGMYAAFALTMAQHAMNWGELLFWGVWRGMGGGYHSEVRVTVYCELTLAYCLFYPEDAAIVDVRKRSSNILRSSPRVVTIPNLGHIQ